ncbi:hypothetical protein EDB92DRAFT_1821068 [Lactarius akahatsu]|uniref:Uncharacterized protein n=1 Tax=Lactarius akahatsu TaxID=416441 RepID=A0AAD4Q2U7_9AGAM|nr:hypothetical protein EDB92DRAFT_1821068 [Lactarius akahatsu]
MSPTPHIATLPTSRPLSLAILSSLTLPDERPPLPPIIDLCDDDEDTFLNDHLPLASPLLPPPSIEDDTTLNRGMETLNTSVSTSHASTSHSIYTLSSLTTLSND